MSEEEGKSLKARLFGISCFLLAVSIVPSIWWAWPAYTYKYGDVAEVTYGAPCVSTRSRGHVTTSCRASWVLDGVRHDGEITENLAADLPGSSGVIRTRVWGDTARTNMERTIEYRLGLVAPWLSVPALLVILTLLPVLLWTTVRDGWADAVKARDAAKAAGGSPPPN
jgi:hypothetical protein